MIQSISY